MTSFHNLSSKQKVQAALHRDVRAICTEACHFMGLEVSKSATEIIAEIVFKKCILYGSDLEAFAKHAKRSTINAEDVKLLVRRNPTLKIHLNAMSTNSASKEKRRKTIPLVSKPVETPSKPNTNELKKDAENEEDMAVDHTIDLTFD